MFDSLVRLCADFFASYQDSGRYDLTASLWPTSCDILERLSTIGEIKSSPQLLFENGRTR